MTRWSGRWHSRSRRSRSSSLPRRSQSRSSAGATRRRRRGTRPSYVQPCAPPRYSGMKCRLGRSSGRCGCWASTRMGSGRSTGLRRTRTGGASRAGASRGACAGGALGAIGTGAAGRGGACGAGAGTETTWSEGSGLDSGRPGAGWTETVVDASYAGIRIASVTAEPPSRRGTRNAAARPPAAAARTKSRITKYLCPRPFLPTSLE